MENLKPAETAGFKFSMFEGENVQKLAGEKWKAEIYPVDFFNAKHCPLISK